MGGEVRLCDKPVAWRIRLVEEAPCGPLLVRDGRLIVPMALFTGPPGTGKTHAMRILAGSANLKAYVFDAVGLQEVSWEPEKLFVRILEHISGLEKAIVLIDECETVFGNRDALATYGSAFAQKQMKLLTSFIRWVEGLETQNDWENRQVMLVMATNMPAALDAAVRSRVRVAIRFPLPSAEQCTEWWQKNACHLGPAAWKQLGTASVGLSFRGWRGYKIFAAVYALRWKYPRS